MYLHTRVSHSHVHTDRQRCIEGKREMKKGQPCMPKPMTQEQYLQSSRFNSCTLYAISPAHATHFLKRISVHMHTQLAYRDIEIDTVSRIEIDTFS